MTAIPISERDQHLATMRDVFHAVESVDELPNGYAFQMKSETALLEKTAAFITRERLCCPFLRLTLEIEPEGGPLWLKLTGRDGVKPFIRAEIGEALRGSVAEPGGFR